VIKTVEMAVKNCHVEITCLLIPGLNDSVDEQEELARWLGNLNPDLVLHYSRYFPQYKLDLPPTEPQVMEEMLAVAKRYLHYVYLGNIELPGSAVTNCPHCGKLLIARGGYLVRVTGLNGQYCQNCGSKIAITLAD
ncbi:MAG: AmmeMemoRadiSam system radical SAM enzyme, partial [Dethiobacteria bacterium]|nr:AmmeMemoRadiSam system radical SAM enzyme [Dethiobacteria bacterium]